MSQKQTPSQILSDINELKRSAILEAIEATRTAYHKDGAEWLCRVEDLTAHANNLVKETPCQTK